MHFFKISHLKGTVENRLSILQGIPSVVLPEATEGIRVTRTLRIYQKAKSSRDYFDHIPSVAFEEEPWENPLGIFTMTSEAEY